jgi:hypothetical protein
MGNYRLEVIEVGLPLYDLVGMAAVMALTDADAERRPALWLLDCAARALNVFEAEHPTDTRPRRAIIVGRRIVRSEIPWRSVVSLSGALWPSTSQPIGQRAPTFAAIWASARETARANSTAASIAKAAQGAADAEER